ncbi:uncharacterized protein N7459_002652 [Penicillium hispanicum]|uniref:uncharacterized protein n=1 Tax=Penicillium hispanicum TaxID=1080232 RepID=UPI00253FA9E8|nr:uncharacterized protein N7459_002652 [Penicillium hispanicum]KAJ5586887.1 hypothetical protein N7459_002652 [Penicillium hispanicum]
MHALIIGGSGRTGKLVVEEMLQRKHEVTVLVRNPSAMQEQKGLSLVKGTPTKVEDVRKAFAQRTPDVVIVTLSAPRESDSPFAAPASPPRLMADCNANIVTVMKEFGVKKVVILQAFGVGESWGNMPCLLRMLMSKSNMSYQYEDHNHADREVRASGVTYVMVRPSRLVETDVLTVREWPHNGKGVGLMASASRCSVARFLADAAIESKWDNSAPVITN